MRPDDLKYTETHEWVKANKKAKTVTFGITDYAVSQLSDLVHIELPEVGDNIEAGQPFGEVESVKAVSDLFAPLSGEVLEVNTEVLGTRDRQRRTPPCHSPRCRTCHLSRALHPTLGFRPSLPRQAS